MLGVRLKRPCAHCPFRRDLPGFLRKSRALEIADGLARHGDFACHETIEYGDDEDDEEDGTAKGVVTPRSQHCAGALILLLKIGRPNILMRLRMLSGEFHPDECDMEAPVFDTLEEFVRHHINATFNNTLCAIRDQENDEDGNGTE